MSIHIRLIFTDGTSKLLLAHWLTFHRNGKLMRIHLDGIVTHSVLVDDIVDIHIERIPKSKLTMIPCAGCYNDKPLKYSGDRISFLIDPSRQFPPRMRLFNGDTTVIEHSVSTIYKVHFL